MGAPDGNHNATRSGLETVIDNRHLRYGLPSPRLPKKHRFIDHRVDELRRQLEQAVIEKHGNVSITHADLISASMDHERGRQFLYARLRVCEEHEDKPLTDPVVIQLVQVIGKCADARSACISKLHLDADPKIIAATLYTEPATSEPDESFKEQNEERETDAQDATAAINEAEPSDGSAEPNRPDDSTN